MDEQFERVIELMNAIVEGQHELRRGHATILEAALLERDRHDALRLALKALMTAAAASQAFNRRALMTALQDGDDAIASETEAAGVRAEYQVLRTEMLRALGTA